MRCVKSLNDLIGSSLEPGKIVVEIEKSNKANQMNQANDHVILFTNVTTITTTKNI